MKRLARLFALLSVAFGSLHYIEAASQRTMLLLLPRVLAGALSPLLTLLGALAAGVGLLRRDGRAFLGGLLGAALSGYYFSRVTARHDGFERAFGDAWAERVPPSRRAMWASQRWEPRTPEWPEPRWQRDLAFWTVPGPEGAERPLLCDLWQPPEGVEPSGLAFIYLHGSGWHYLDKDTATRPMFRRLAAQGHVCMDVAYRMCPEVQWREMLGDVKRAIAWMKAHAAEYGVDPAQVVISGGSAGGHLALLAAYTADRPGFAPADVGDTDTSVAGVASFYGPPDLRAFYEFGRERYPAHLDPNAAMLAFSLPLMRKLGIDPDVGQVVFGPSEMIAGLVGGRPEDCPEDYALASPITHAGPGCPPSLILQGGYDFGVRPDPVRQLHHVLTTAGVPVVYVELPFVDHGFDLFLPEVSPPAQAALYDLERFLALLAA